MSSAAVDIYDPFASDVFLRIERIEILRTPVLRAHFSDGESRTIDFSQVIEESRWFRTLAVPTTFETAEIINDGRALQWITGADYCADALRILADTQAAERQDA